MNLPDRAPRRPLVFLAIAVLIAIAPPAPTQGDVGASRDFAHLACWPRSARANQLAFEQALNRISSAEQLDAYHRALASVPHVAGTEGDRKVIAALKKAFADAGLEVESQPIWVYLSRFVSADVEIVEPDAMKLPIREEALAEDPYSRNPELMSGFNAYAASGDVTAGVVYANYGTRADFARLKKLGVSVKGKIVLARYGRNYRGFKAKFAERDGAVGLIIYTDPADSGYKRGDPYPVGGFANASQIQRGSIKTIPYPGDPLTPFVEATEDAKRIDAETLALPKIPVQPVGWAAAEQIMKRMTGEAAPEKWRGGLPLDYRLTGGEKLRVRLRVEQEREIVRTENVFGVIEGETHPDEMIVLGCHHDAWGYGAGDPMAGMIVKLEVARAFAELAKAGRRPARTLVFAAWAAEEHGIIGSVEWVEANRKRLAESCVAYINLDMAAMGPYIGAGAAPTLRRVIADATREVEQIGKGRGSAAEGPARTVFEVWRARREDPTFPGYPAMGDMGGGSDHVGFNCHLGIPCCGIGVRGAPGVSYHSIYDNLAWYRKIVGGYEPARMLARVVNVLAARLANAPLLPLDPTRIAPHFRLHLHRIDARARAAGLAEREDMARVEALSKRAEAFGRAVEAAHGRVLDAVATGRLDEDRLAKANRALMAFDRAWVDDEGLPGRPWYRNTFAATDEDSGYAAWVLPLFHHALKHGDAARWRKAIERYERVLDRLEEIAAELAAAASPATDPTR